MTLTYYVGGKLTGLASERPLTNNLPEFTTFIETDTFKEYIWDGIDTWNQIGVSGANMDDSGLLAYYTFEETSGNLINKSESASSVGTAGEGVNTAGVVQGDPDGIIGNAYKYNGANGTKTTLGTVLSTFNQPLSSIAKWSFILWLKPTATGSNDVIFDSKNASGGNAGIRLRFQTGGTLTAIGTNTTPAGIFNSGVTTLTLSTGSYQMIHMTYDFELASDNFKIGVDDGTKEAVNTENAGLNGNPAFDLTLAEAALGNDNAYNGLMDEVSIWERVLTDAEITTLFNAGNGFSIYG